MIIYYLTNLLIHFLYKFFHYWIVHGGGGGSSDTGAGLPQQRKLWALSSNGVRTIGATSVYVQVRKTGDANDANRGEISKSYWDAH